MNFSSLSFLFVFLPVVMLLYFLFQKRMSLAGSSRYGNVVIAVASVLFYCAVVPSDVFILIGFILVVYFFGWIIQKAKCKNTGAEIECCSDETKKKNRLASVLLLFSVLAVLYVLVHYKYRFFIANTVSYFHEIDIDKYSNTRSILGISFIVFSAISYLVDIYRQDATTGSVFDAALYITFFPKVISGPIVLWKDFRKQITYRAINTDAVVQGINRIAVGLAKKVILADTFGSYISNIEGQTAIDPQSAWLCWLLYALEIYYDFSGYSDIAIGASKILGFDFKENFDFPYRSLSITEFWRKWHISLGTWFKEYVYIPLGGNRKGLRRTLINLGIVFALTGIWHGAGWAYVLWGTIHGVCVIIERIIKDKAFYKRIPAAVKWLFTFFIVASAWQLFRFGHVTPAVDWFKLMLGMTPYDRLIYSWKFFFDARIITLIIIAVLGATVMGSKRVLDVYNRLQSNQVFYAVQEIIVVLIFILSIIYIVNSSFSPFIYFQF